MRRNRPHRPGHRSIVAALEETGQLDNTLLIFLSDNGACAEDIPQGVTARELVDQLMIAKAKTRKGEPVRSATTLR